MKTHFCFFLFFILFYTSGYCQNSKGIHLQAIARNENGIIIPNKQISLRLSILNDTSNASVDYQEIVSVTTNVLGLFFVNIGVSEISKVITIGNFEQIQWQLGDHYLQVEVDPNNTLSFIQAGIEKINYVPLSLYAEKANMVTSVIPIELGGTGVVNLKELSKLLSIDKINNTPDSLKPISVATNLILNEKLKKVDTISLSNRINSIPKLDTTSLSSRINTKLNAVDTAKLSSRINTKLNSTDTLSISTRINLKLNVTDTISLSNRINNIAKVDTSSLSNRINSIPKIDTTSLSNRINLKISLGAITNNDIVNGLGYSPVKNEYGLFYDTARQAPTSLTAGTAIKFSFQQLSNKITVINNTSGMPTRITITDPGVYQVNYMLQVIKSDAGTDELSIWIRRNGSAFLNSNYSYTIQGASIKNVFNGSYLVDLGTSDYVELYFSVKNLNSNLVGSATALSPSRPATPSAMISIHAVN